MEPYRSALIRKSKTEDRVRAHTRPEINDWLDNDLERRIRFYAGQDREEISRRIEQLDREWDIERAIEANAAGLSVGALVLGMLVSRKWLLLPLAISGFLLNHAIDGWCPPVPLFRSRGLRTRMEIERERYALRILRGDFDTVLRAEAGKKDADELVQDLKR